MMFIFDILVLKKYRFAIHTVSISILIGSSLLFTCNTKILGGGVWRILLNYALDHYVLSV